VGHPDPVRPVGFSGEDGVEMAESERVPSSLAPSSPSSEPPKRSRRRTRASPTSVCLCMPHSLILDAWILFSTCSLLLFIQGRYVAFVKVHTLDPNSSGRGVQQFKTYLLHRLEKVRI
jgi:hypothetical protein